jgi:tetratricopeptide (TPR) repeat protein
MSVLLMTAVWVASCSRPTSGTPPQAAAPEPPVVDAPVLPLDRFAEPTAWQQELQEGAWEFLQTGSTDLGMTALLALADSEPGSEVRANGMLVLAQLYLDEGRPADALAVLERLASWAPPMVTLEYLMGLIHAEQGDAAQAIERFRRTVRIDADWLPAWLALEEQLRLQERPDEAAEIRVQIERQIQRMGESLGQALAPDAKRVLIRHLSVIEGRDDVSRALVRALEDDADAVVEDALMALATAGTQSALPALQALESRARTPALVALVAEVRGQLEARFGGRGRRAR